MPAIRRSLSQALTERLLPALAPALAMLAFGLPDTLSARGTGLPGVDDADPRPATAAVTATDEPLYLDAVLDSSRRHFPDMLAAQAKLRAEQGDRLSSEGGFDRYLQITGRSRLSGFYDGRNADTKLVQPLESLGGRIYGGYRVSSGDFPVYEDELATLDGGEFKVGVVLSLLRDRDIDSRRAARSDANLQLEQANLDILFTLIGVQLDAMHAYYEWIAAGRALQIYQGLLTLAEKRQQGFETRIEEGDLPRSYRNENLQSILRRRELTVEAQRRLAIAANRLALYARDEGGQPLRIGPERLPQAWPELPPPLQEQDIEASIRSALAARPELAALAADIQREQIKLDLGKNRLRSRVDLNLEASRDLGEGPPRREETDSIVRLDVVVPLQTRGARGDIQAAQARLEVLRQQKRLQEERIATEVRSLAVELHAAERFVALTREEIEQADFLADAERERFSEGASDFFVVNLREEAAANAAIRGIQSHKELHIARANFHAATLQIGPFRLD